MATPLLGCRDWARLLIWKNVTARVDFVAPQIIFVKEEKLLPTHCQKVAEEVKNSAGLASTQRSSGTNAGLALGSTADGSPTLLPPTEAFSGPLTTGVQLLHDPLHGQAGAGLLLDSSLQVQSTIFPS